MFGAVGSSPSRSRAPDLIELSKAARSFPTWAIPEKLLGETQRFLTDLWEGGAWEGSEPDRILATVLFSDIVDSSARAASLGDRAWRELLERTTTTSSAASLCAFAAERWTLRGDGFFASFDGPSRAIRCGCAIAETVPELGLEVRVGLHTGECEVFDGKVAGICGPYGCTCRLACETGRGTRLKHREETSWPAQASPSRIVALTN